MTMRKYKLIDIAILTATALLADVVSYWVKSKFVQDTLYIAPSIIFVIIIYIRWGKLGIASNVLLMIAQITIYRHEILASTPQLVGFILGYLSLSSVLIWTGKKKHDIISSGFKMITLYLIIPYGLMILLEAGASNLLGFEGTFVTYWGRHVMNLPICLIIMVIAVFQKNLLVDMPTYLKEQQKERDEKNEYRN